MTSLLRLSVPTKLNHPETSPARAAVGLLAGLQPQTKPPIYAISPSHKAKKTTKKTQKKHDEYLIVNRKQDNLGKQYGYIVAQPRVNVQCQTYLADAASSALDVDSLRFNLSLEHSVKDGTNKWSDRGHRILPQRLRLGFHAAPLHASHRTSARQRPSNSMIEGGVGN